MVISAGAFDVDDAVDDDEEPQAARTMLAAAANPTKERIFTISPKPYHARNVPKATIVTGMRQNHPSLPLICLASQLNLRI